MDMLGPRLVLLLALSWCVWRGGWPERSGAALIMTDFAIRLALAGVGHPLDFHAGSVIHLTFSAFTFAAAMYLAIKSNRVWPLFLAALALITLSGHLSVLILHHRRIMAYWIMTQVPIISQVAVVVIGTMAHAARERAGVRAPDWS